MTPPQRHSATLLLDWLAVSDRTDGEFDAVIGFGHFDLRIVDRCAERFRRGGVARVVFTGGIGAGTADLGGPEADAFFAHLTRRHPDVPPEDVVLENASTNTAENIRNTLGLRERTSGLSFRRVVLVANPSRQRRVMQTWKQLVPDSEGRSDPPRTTLDEELRIFDARRQALIGQLVGEVDRLVQYPARGWIAPCEVPAAVRAAAEVCRELIA